MEKVIGFIGAGNMGQAMVGGMLKEGIIKSSNVIM